MFIVDSHCHIISEEFANDREECIKRAFDNGVRVILDASGGVEKEKLQKMQKVCWEHENVYATVGVHPEEAENFADISADKLIKLCRPDYIIGIGECGLDYHYNPNSKDIQIKVFLEHIKAAQTTQLPLIVHSRDADDDMMEILTREYKKEPFKGELHCFSSSAKLAETALKIGFFISASGIITFKKSEELCNIFSKVPLEKLLIETDAPYLAPVPFRGKRNEPAYVIKTAEKLAEIKNESLDDLAKMTSANFYRLFTKALPFGGLLQDVCDSVMRYFRT